jgi:hypothetical protein
MVHYHGRPTKPLRPRPFLSRLPGPRMGGLLCLLLGVTECPYLPIQSLEAQL